MTDIVGGLRASVMELADHYDGPHDVWVRYCAATKRAADEIEQLRARIVGLEAMLCDAQAEAERLLEAVDRACNSVEALEMGRRDAVLRIRAALGEGARP